jgi:hypothetical protein
VSDNVEQRFETDIYIYINAAHVFGNPLQNKTTNKLEDYLF